MSNHDDLDGIFDHLDPQDFERDTSAVDELPLSANDYASFDAFVDEQLRTLRISYFTSSGQVDPLAVLVSSTETLLFTADDDESLGEWVARVHREAERVGAIWTFVSKKTLVGAQDEEAPPNSDLNDPEVVEKAIAAGQLVMGMAWYGEANDRRTPRRHRLGAIPEVGYGRLGESVENSTQNVPLFAQILD